MRPARRQDRDEPIIALDLENLVTELGHRVVAVAATKDDAVAKAKSERPGLVLADINLGEGGSGIDVAFQADLDGSGRQASTSDG